MTFVKDPYDALYTNLKNKLTVVKDNREYTVGEYMLTKAGADKSSSMALTKRAPEQTAIVSVINFVNEKLTVKNPPKKDKTIRRFPIRASFSAFLSAVAALVLVVSCGIYSLLGSDKDISTTTVDTSNHLEIELHNFDDGFGLN